MSRIARKSSVAQSNADIDYSVKESFKQKNIFHGIVLDICGAHKPFTKFLPDKYFEKGIYFIVILRENYEVYDIYYNESYDYLRTVHGTDENIIGRNIVIFSEDATEYTIRYSNFNMLENRRNKFQDESLIRPMSIGFLTGGAADPENALKGFYINPNEGFGETWRKIK
jgi:hypothetical protein